VVAGQALVVVVEVVGLDLLELEVVVPEVPLVRTPGGDCCKQPKVHLRKTVVPMWPSPQRWPIMCAA